MKTIYIGFSKHKGFAPLSKLIRIVLKSEFSHTYFKFQQDNLDEPTVFHAVGKGVEYIAESNFKKHNEVVKEFKIEIEDKIYNYLMNICHKHASKKYGVWQNLGIFFVKILHKMGIKYRRNPFNDGVNCSEWVYHILASIYPKWISKSADLVDPLDVYNFLNKK